MIKFTTTLYETNQPNRNGRVYAEGCFDHINKEDKFPVFLSKEPRMDDLLCQATVDWQDHCIDIQTEPICNNWRNKKAFEALIESFSRGQFAIVPSGHGEMIYDPNKDCYIIKDYRLDHFYITNQPAFKYKSKMELV